MNKKEFLDKWVKETIIEGEPGHEYPVFKNWEEMKYAQECSSDDLEEFAKFAVQQHEKEMNDYIEFAKKSRSQLMDELQEKIIKDELSFLEGLDIPDLYKQASSERSHFYVASKCKSIMERMELLSSLIKQSSKKVK